MSIQGDDDIFKSIHIDQFLNLISYFENEKA